HGEGRTKSPTIDATSSTGGERYPRGRRPVFSWRALHVRRDAASVVAKRLDELVLVHVGTTLDADLRGALLELFLRAVLVALALAALLADVLAAGLGVGDARGLLLALALVAELLVELVVLHAGSMVLGHQGHLLRVGFHPSGYPGPAAGNRA